MKNMDNPFFRKFRKEYIRIICWPLFAFGLILILIPLDSFAVSDDANKSYLLKKYAPVLYFHAEEKVFPWGIRSMLDNADLKKVENERKAYMPLSPGDLLSNNSNRLYLDLRKIVPYHDSVTASNIQDKIFEKYPFRVYGRQIDPGSNSTHIFLQYWLFYPFNHWYNDHEGDWEMVQIRYAKDRHEPDQLTTSHHHSGTVIEWNRVSKVEGTHPKIFVAKGGHGNWPTSGNHAVGKIWKIIGIFRDKTSQNGMVLFPEDIGGKVNGKKQKYILEDVSGLPRSSWVYWNGRWGDVKVLFWGSRGPESPGVQQKWKNPIKWGNKPQKSSFWVYFGSPGYLHIYDRHGNHDGINEKVQKKAGKIEGNIPGTYFYVPASDKVPETCAWINTSEDLRFEIKAKRSGNFKFAFDFDPGLAMQNEEGIAISVLFKDVKINKGGTATIKIQSEKLSKRLEAILKEKPLKKESPGSTEFDSTESELEKMANKTRLYIKRKSKKNAAVIMEEELAELDAVLMNDSLKKSATIKDTKDADLNLAELELENMADIVRLSKNLVRKKLGDRVDEELKEAEDTLKGINLLERLLKPIFIMKIDLDGDGTIDQYRQADKITWMR